MPDSNTRLKDLKEILKGKRIKNKEDVRRYFIIWDYSKTKESVWSVNRVVGMLK